MRKSKSSTNNGLANPANLNPFDASNNQLLRVVIETPKGSRNKFAFDAREHIFELKKVLPAGQRSDCCYGPEWHFPTTSVSFHRRKPTMAIPWTFWC